MFTAQCRGEAFAIVGIHALIRKTANASPLLFQKTKLLQIKKFLHRTTDNKRRAKLGMLSLMQPMRTPVQVVKA